MTTIVYNHKDGEIASDSQVTSGDLIQPWKCTKLIRINSGWVAMSGSVVDYGSYINILEGKDISGDKTNLKNQCLVIPDKGDSYNFWFDSLGHPVKEVVTGSWAIGSGREYALGALAVGASAKEAVRAAIKYDIYSGGKIVVKSRGDLK
jgi:ATP-dependent protease HslVU (ClpYQ) peptidase subunit